MTDPRTSQRLANELSPGTHHLDNRDLRRLYGVSRVTAKARTEIASDLRRAGLEILSDPAYEPLTVRKTATQRVSIRPAKARVWWKRPWAIAVGAFLLLAMLGAMLEDPDAPSGAGNGGDAEAVAPATTTASSTEPEDTFADAEQAVEDGRFTRALAVASELGESDRDRIRRKISRTLAKRARRALRAGDRGAASAILRRSRRYGTTPEIRAARTSLNAAHQRAARRAAERRAAREQAAQERRAARQRAAQERAAREAAEREAAEAPPTPEYDAPETPDSSGGGTGNWCGASRDGDGDGIWCEE